MREVFSGSYSDSSKLKDFLSKNTVTFTLCRFEMIIYVLQHTALLRLFIILLKCLFYLEHVPDILALVSQSLIALTCLLTIIFEHTFFVLLL